VEIEEVGAAAQEDVLAVVEFDTGVFGVFEGGGAAAEGVAGLEGGGFGLGLAVIGGGDGGGGGGGDGAADVGVVGRGGGGGVGGVKGRGWEMTNDEGRMTNQI